MENNSVPVLVVGMAWYLEEDFKEIKRLMADAHTLHDTHAQWLLAASAGEEQYRRAGRHVVRAVIRPQEFKHWCQVRNLKIDAQARMAFANFRAKEAADKGELN